MIGMNDTMKILRVGMPGLLSGLLLVLVVVLSAPGAAWAVMPDEMLDDPELEQRARVISKDIRCLVCQNQSIDDSNADLARDLRIIVRERLVEGDTNDEVKSFLVDRYGDYVLLTPPMTLGTMLLWGGPFVLVGLGGLAVMVWFRGRAPAAPASGGGGPGSGLSAEERRRLERLMAEDEHGDTDGGDRSARG
jgi:cytochrome c-type biogenesis protein CcmH